MLAARCVLRVARCVFGVVCCMLRVVQCVLRGLLFSFGKDKKIKWERRSDLPQREEGRKEKRGEEKGKVEAPPAAHLLEGAEKVRLRGAHATSREAGSTIKEDAQRPQRASPISGCAPRLSVTRLSEGVWPPVTQCTAATACVQLC